MKSKGDFPSMNARPADGIRPGGKPYKIFVVDSKDFQKKQIIQILESEKYQVVGSASNGREAIDLLKKLNYDVDLITTELDMPILDGYALLYEIKALDNPKPVAFISDETTGGVMQDLITMGISDFILKPISRRVVLERIRKIIVKIESTRTDQ